MRVICVEDEINVLEDIVALCRDIPAVDEAFGFTKASEALDYIKNTKTNIAILDIELPETDGLKLAAKMKAVQPDISIIFATAYSKYAVDAFAMHVSGYLMKPITKKALSAEIEYALTGRVREEPAHIKVTTFDGFEVEVNGKSVEFRRSKSKELFAYLVDKCGKKADRKEVFAALWENGIYDRKIQKQLDVIVHSLKETLAEYGISEVFEIKRGVMRIFPEMIDCDVYKFLKGDIDAVNSYKGRYMPAYSWADFTEAMVTWEILNKK